MAATGYNIRTTSAEISFRDQTTGLASISYDHNSEKLVISHDGTGDISIGDTSSDVYIGDGISNVDLIFETDGGIYADSGSALTLGLSSSNVEIDSPTTINNNLNITGDLGVSGNFELGGTSKAFIISDSSATTLFSVQGAAGEVFSVDNALTGTIFGVYDSSALPIIEVESVSGYDKITIGEYGSDALVISGTNSAKFNVDVSMTGALDVTGDITMGGETVLTGITSGDITGALGYTPLSSETDDQTLDEVLAQGNTSTRDISVGAITGSSLTTSEITTSSGSLTLNPTGPHVFLPSGKKLYGSNVGFGYQTSAVSALQFYLGASIDNPDIKLHRDGAAQLALRDGSASQEFRVYNTYTDASNYERGYIGWDSNVLEIGSEKLGTGSLRSMKINSALGLTLQSNSNGQIKLLSSGNTGIVLESTGAHTTIKRSASATTSFNNILNLQSTGSGGLKLDSRSVSGVNYEVKLTSTGSYTKKFFIEAGSQAGGQVGTDMIIKAGSNSGAPTLRCGDLYLAGQNSSGSGRDGNIIFLHDSTNSSNGNVGIGTTSPSYPLDVAGNIGLDGDNRHIYFGGANTFIGENSNSNKLELRGGGNNTAKTVFIDNDGRLGIGDSAPSYKLDVNGTGRFVGDLYVDADLDVTGDITMGGETVLTGITSGDITGALGYTPLSSETDDQTLQEILDATPSATGTINVDVFSGISGVLDVIQATGDLTLQPLGSDGNGGKLILDGDSFATALQIENNGQIDWGATTYRFGLQSTYWQWKSWSKPIHIVGGAGTVMYIGTPAGDGNVGIGTTSPTAKLHVNNDTSAVTGLLVENSSNKNILWAEDDETVNVRSTFNVYHSTVASRYLRLGWGSIFANDNNNELTLGSNFSSSSATRILVAAESADNVPEDTIQMQANRGLAVFSGSSSDTFDPEYLLHVSGTAGFEGAVSITSGLDVTGDITMGGETVLTGITSGDITGALGYTPLSSETDDQTLQEILDATSSATGTINVDIFSGYSGVFDAIQSTGDLLFNDGDIFLKSDGRVGLGVTPSLGYVKLDVGSSTNDKVSAAGYLIGGGSREISTFGSLVNYYSYNGHRFTTWDNSLGQLDRLRIINNGNVGINDGTPSYTLDVNGTGRFVNDLYVDADLDVTGDITMGGETVLTGITSGDITGALGYTPLSSETDDQTLDEVLTQGNTSSSEITVGGATINGDIDVTGDAYITGRVGIGTDNPDHELHIISTGWNGIRIESTTTSGAVLDLKNTQRRFSVASRSNSFQIRDITASDTARLTINSSGDVGIGTTSPSQKLHVEGVTYSTLGFKVANGYSIGALGYNSALRFNNGNILVNNSSAAEFVRFDATNSRVGIGATSPSEELEVYPDSNSSAIIGRAHIGHVGHSDFAGFSHLDQDSSTSYALLQGSNGATYLNTASGRSLHFRINNNDKATINASGNFGIGTTGPSYKLDVNGTLRAVGAATFDSTLTLAGLSGQASEATALMINGSNVVGTRELGSNAFTSTSYAPLASPTFTGDVAFSHKKIYGFQRTLPTTVDDIVEIGNTGLSSGAGHISMQVVVASSGFSVTKSYTIPIGYNETSGAWNLLNSTHDTGPYSSNDFEVDIKVDNGNVALRIRRTSGSTAGLARINLELSGATLSFSETSSTDSVTAPTAYYNPNVISQKQDGVHLPDNSKFKIGNGDDLQIHHDGNHSYIRNNITGSLYIQSANSIQLESSTGEDMLTAAANGAVNLYYDNNKKLETTSSGITVTGTTSSSNLTLTGLSTYSGSDVTALMINGSNIVGKRTLGSAAFSATGDFATASHNHTLDSLSNVTITSNTSGEVLRWSGSAWINSTLSEAGIQASSTALTTSTTFGGDVSGTYNAIVVANDSHTHNANNLTGTTLASGVTASSLTTVGTITSGTWNGSVIASAYLDADTAHLSGTQTFSGVKTFSATVDIAQDLRHSGDTDTYLRMQDDLVRIVAGNIDMIRFTESTQNSVVINDGGNDVDFRFESDTLTHALFIEGSSGNVGIGSSTPDKKLVVRGADSEVVIDDTNSTPVLRFRNSGTTAGYIETNSSQDMKFHTGGVSEAVRINSSGNVGIGTSSPSAKLEVNGHFAATTKSFIIDNPKTGGKLQYGVVESDQHSVLVRGKNDTNEIELPEEWEWLVDPDSVTVDLTSIGQIQQLFVISQDNKKIKIGGLAINGQYNYTVYGERVDVDKLQVNI